MKVLVVGSGGREHALCYKISASDQVEEVYCAPGNGGISEQAKLLELSAIDLDGIVKASHDLSIDLVVVGPEDPLSKGLTDALEAEGKLVFGCSGKAARLEGSKVFAKKLMRDKGIPTGDFEAFEDKKEAEKFVRGYKGKLVVKADGLAAGKGVMVCDNESEALSAVDLVMGQKAFGGAGDKVLIEERLFGEEASFLVFTDGKNIVPLAGSQDHKAVYDGDKGPNTGGMGAYSPAPVIDDKMHDRVINEVITPTIEAMNERGIPYKGVLYAGLMITEHGPQVLEFNCRFGDPETQPLLFRMKSDIIDFLLACARADGSLSSLEIEWGDPTVCVVMASKGYPGNYEKGKVISGIEEANKIDGAYVFHAGTDKKDGKILTSGGRVLGVTASGPDIKKAIDKAYKAVMKISWEGAYYRKDIGQKALGRK